MPHIIIIFSLLGISCLLIFEWIRNALLFFWPVVFSFQRLLYYSCLTEHEFNIVFSLLGISYPLIFEWIRNSLLFFGLSFFHSDACYIIHVSQTWNYHFISAYWAFHAHSYFHFFIPIFFSAYIIPLNLFLLIVHFTTKPNHDVFHSMIYIFFFHYRQSKKQQDFLVVAHPLLEMSWKNGQYLDLLLDPPAAEMDAFFLKNLVRKWRTLLDPR